MGKALRCLDHGGEARNSCSVSAPGSVQSSCQRGRGHAQRQRSIQRGRDLIQWARRRRCRQRRLGACAARLIPRAADAQLHRQLTVHASCPAGRCKRCMTASVCGLLQLLCCCITQAAEALSCLLRLEHTACSRHIQQSSWLWLWLLQ